MKLFEWGFTIPVAPRTKKNHGNIVTLKTGRTLMLPSKQYKEFEKQVIDFVSCNFKGTEPITEPINLCCKFYKDKDYKADLVGYLQAIQDALVKAKLILDDNHKIVASTDGSEILLDRNNPRIEITITFKKGA
jgi:Holliday junction resolvase RusA-like endonuclease